MKLPSHTIYIFTFLMLAFLRLHSQEAESLKLLLTNNSKLTISGTSNITKFDCKLKQDFEKDTLVLIAQYDDQHISFGNAKSKFYVNRFRCGHEPINRDFRQALREKEYPTISLSVERLYLTDDFKIENKYADVRADIMLELAGVQKTYEIGFGKIEVTQKELSFAGSKEVKMSDFNIDPPKALMGLIKTKNDLTIHFDFDVLLIERGGGLKITTGKLD